MTSKLAKYIKGVQLQIEDSFQHKPFDVENWELSLMFFEKALWREGVGNFCKFTISELSDFAGTKCEARKVIQTLSRALLIRNANFDGENVTFQVDVGAIQFHPSYKVVVRRSNMPPRSADPHVRGECEVPVKVIQSQELSLEARGVYFTLLTEPDTKGSELAEWLSTQSPDCTPEQASEFINELISHDLLKRELDDWIVCNSLTK
ncbi:hypothetical protein [Vibrio parahaemolyticus]|uniref:hypothetical protein n=1 Tax=Vibrio parahaemolyticus TaxID=670 RepID=UPI0025530139|nr:hypothetical protein [Vibrio parahaemolyticus]